MRIGYGVKAYRRDRGWNQTTLAERAGLDQTSISKIESDKNEPMLSTAVTLAKALEVSVDDLLRRSELEYQLEKELEVAQ